jgi:hypothetical protein
MHYILNTFVQLRVKLLRIKVQIDCHDFQSKYCVFKTIRPFRIFSTNICWSNGRLRSTSVYKRFMFTLNKLCQQKVLEFQQNAQWRHIITTMTLSQ